MSSSTGVHYNGVLKRLFAEVVSSQMICFAMGDRCGSVGVGRKVVELCDSIVGTRWHGRSPNRQMLSGRGQFSFGCG
ncbi:MAG: hypothetical protein WCC32_07570 [Terriglobales bacterium]